MKHLTKIIHLGAKNGPVGRNGLNSHIVCKKILAESLVAFIFPEPFNLSSTQTNQSFSSCLKICPLAARALPIYQFENQKTS